MNLLIDKPSGLPILMIDASVLKESGCMRRFKFQAVDGLRVGESSPKIAIEFGVGFHKFAADFHAGLDVGGAIQKAVTHLTTLNLTYGPREYRTPEKLFQTCFNYSIEWKFDNFTILRNAVTNEALVEQKFAIEYPGFEHLGFKVLLVGTIDAIGLLNSRELVIMDHKTTSVWDMDDYLESYQASPQLKFYKLVLQKYAELYPETFGQFSEAGTMINGIFLTKAGDAKFKRSEVFNFSETRMKEFEALLHYKITQLCHLAVKTGYPVADGMMHNLCHSHFGKCPFFAGCVLNEDEQLEDWIASRCTSKLYDPRTFGGI